MGEGATVSEDTAAQLDDQLGLYDQLAIEVTASRASRKASLTAQLFHSADRRHWIRKQMLPEVPKTLLDARGTTSLPFGFDDGAVPSLAFVRLRLTLSAPSGPVSAFVTVDVTVNDEDPREFARSAGDYLHRQRFGCEQWIPGGTTISPWDTIWGKIPPVDFHWDYVAGSGPDDLWVLPRGVNICVYRKDGKRYRQYVDDQGGALSKPIAWWPKTSLGEDSPKLNATTSAVVAAKDKP